MAYTKTVWKDRQVQKPLTFTIQNNGDGTITLIPEEGTIIEPGTPVNAFNMNKIENRISEFDTLLIPWTTVPSWNGWSDGVKYCKTRTGVVTVEINANSLSGIISNWVGIAALPVGIRPKVSTCITILDSYRGYIYPCIINPSDGSICIGPGLLPQSEGLTENTIYSTTFSYYVES